MCLLHAQCDNCSWAEQLRRTGSPHVAVQGTLGRHVQTSRPRSLHAETSICSFEQLELLLHWMLTRSVCLSMSVRSSVRHTAFGGCLSKMQASKIAVPAGSSAHNCVWCMVRTNMSKCQEAYSSWILVQASWFVLLVCDSWDFLARSWSLFHKLLGVLDGFVKLSRFQLIHLKAICRRSSPLKPWHTLTNRPTSTNMINSHQLVESESHIGS